MSEEMLDTWLVEVQYKHPSTLEVMYFNVPWGSSMVDSHKRHNGDIKVYLYNERSQTQST